MASHEFQYVGVIVRWTQESSKSASSISIRYDRTHLGVVADVIPPRRVKHVIAFHDLLKHFRLVVRVERLVATQTDTHVYRPGA